MSENIDQMYQETVGLAETDPNVLGFVLAGSRGKSFATEYSDYDCAMIVRDEVSEIYRVRMNTLAARLDVGVYTLREFAEHAAWGSLLAWDRYNWTHLRAQVDKTAGRIQDLIDEKGKIPPGEVKGFISNELDRYINQVYRSIKCLRDGNVIGYRFEAAASLTPLLDVLFAINDGRLRPYYKYLEWELVEFPLQKFSWAPGDLLDMLYRILSEGDLQTQQRVLTEVESVFRVNGYHAIFDSWEEELWIKNYPAQVGGKS